MKPLILFLALALSCTFAFCQSKNNSLYLVFAQPGNFVGSEGLGAAGYSGKGATLYGLNYVRRITKSFAVETGIEYSVNNVLWDYVDYYSTNFTPQPASIKMLTVPIYANFTFFKYFFVDAGFIDAFETSHQSDAIIKDKSGVSPGLGFGAKYGYKNVLVVVNPFYQFHERLCDRGVKFGLGYEF
jgi:hypothetical protein